jgi:hypothetical protein
MLQDFRRRIRGHLQEKNALPKKIVILDVITPGVNDVPNSVGNARLLKANCYIAIDYVYIQINENVVIVYFTATSKRMATMAI